MSTSPSAHMPVSIARLAGAPGSPSKFRLVAELGRGGMGNVYLAVVSGPAGFNKLQVVKRLKPELAQDRDSVTMFLDEARLAARLSHPNVVQTNEVGEEDGHFFIAMEYLEGQSLDALVRKGSDAGRVPLEVHLRILCDALAGLHYAHELVDFDGSPLRLVHRDVTPQNIFVTYDGIAKLLDFGIAKAATSAHETRAGTFKGKCAYMAPEQIVGDRIDRRADLFSMGAVLWQALTGQRLWKGEGDMRIFNRVLNGNIPSPRTVNPDVSPTLEAICMRALSVTREERFQTALEMQTALEEVLERLGSKVTYRDVGRYVSEHFASARASIRAAVDAQLREIAQVSESHPVAPIAMFGPPSEDGSSGSGRRRMAESQSPSAISSLNAGVIVRAPSVPTEPVTPARRSGKIVAGVILLGLAALAVRGSLGRSPASDSSAASPVAQKAEAPAIAQPSATQAPGRELTDVIIVASPPSARLYVDDAPLATNPVESRFVRDGAVHLIRAEARGFKSKTQAVTFKADRVSVEIALEQETSAPRPASGPAPRPAGRAASSPAGDGVPRPSATTPHGIDTSDPWQ